MTTCGDYRIQRATILDLWKIYRLEREIFPKDAYPLIEILLLLVVPGVRNHKVLAPDGGFAGFVSASWGTHHIAAEIITLGIATAHQHQGLGRCLLAYAESKIKGGRVQLSVRVSNHGAIALYQNTGYVTIRRRQRYYRDGEDGYIMEKLLPDNSSYHE